MLFPSPFSRWEGGGSSSQLCQGHNSTEVAPVRFVQVHALSTLALPPTEPGLLGGTVGKPSMGRSWGPRLSESRSPVYHKTITTHGQENAPLTLISSPDNGRGAGRRGVSSELSSIFHFCGFQQQSLWKLVICLRARDFKALFSVSEGSFPGLTLRVTHRTLRHTWKHGGNHTSWVSLKKSSKIWRTLKNPK